MLTEAWVGDAVSSQGLTTSGPDGPPVRWTHRLHKDGTTEWISTGGVFTVTFPAQWIHTEDEGGGPGTVTSPPWEGANIDWLESATDGESAEKVDILASLEVAPF